MRGVEKEIAEYLARKNTVRLLNKLDCVVNDIQIKSSVMYRFMLFSTVLNVITCVLIISFLCSVISNISLNVQN